MTGFLLIFSVIVAPVVFFSAFFAVPAMFRLLIEIRDGVDPLSTEDQFKVYLFILSVAAALALLLLNTCFFY